MTEYGPCSCPMCSDDIGERPEDCPAVDSIDDADHVERLIAFAEAGGWMDGDV